MSIVSVVIPCFNAAAYLDETIASVAAQTDVDWEVIIVDDGSTDSTRELISAWQSRLGERLRSHFGPNCGVSAARNTGTDMARGEYIQYLDSDDLLLPSTLRHRVRALTQGPDVAYCDWQKLVLSNEGNFCLGEVIARSIEEVDKRPEIALFTSFWAPPAALMYRRAVVSKIGGWKLDLPIIQDARFLLDSALVGAKFVRVSGVGAYYRVQHGNTLSTRDPSRFVLDCFHNACQVEDIWRARGGLDDEQADALKNVLGQTARYFYEHDRLKFDEILARLQHIDPTYRPSFGMLGFVSRLVGYPHAEAVALSYRKLKRSVFKN
jgi:glycosyltransferase involved in cell wall biosynthesis